MVAPRLACAIVALLLAAAAAATDVALYVPVDVSIPQTAGGSRDLKMLVPTRPSDGSRIAQPMELFEAVKGAWDGVVATQQAGLMDAKAPQLADVPLAAEEAWHHYRAGQQGVVDSARFLITFTVVPSVQSGGSALHLAAAMGAEARLAELLSDASPDAIEARNGYGHTPLTHAVAMGHAGSVRLLLAAGASAEHRGFDGCTPLMVAGEGGPSGFTATPMRCLANPEPTPTPRPSLASCVWAYGRRACAHLRGARRRLCDTRLCQLDRAPLRCGDRGRGCGRRALPCRATGSVCAHSRWGTGAKPALLRAI